MVLLLAGFPDEHLDEGAGIVWRDRCGYYPGGATPVAGLLRAGLEGSGKITHQIRIGNEH